MNYKMEFIRTQDIDNMLNLNNFRNIFIEFPEFYMTVRENEELVGIVHIQELRPGGFAIIFRYVKDEFRRKGIGEELFKRCCKYLIKMDRFESISIKSPTTRTGWCDRRYKEGFRVSQTDGDYVVLWGGLRLLRKGVLYNDNLY